MFNIGDKIVYPTQGVGIIDTVEEKKFAGKLLDYYKIKILNNGLTVMLPANRLENSNIRLISSESLIDKILDHINDYNPETIDFSKTGVSQRANINSEKYKSGTFIDCIEILTNLTLVDKNNKLNSSDKQIYTNTKKFIVDEIRLAKNITATEASDILDDSLATVVG